jgi:hypothetical protein
VTTLEDRLRAATRAAAQTVAPGSAPPLRLPGHPSPRPAPGRRRRLPDHPSPGPVPGQRHRWAGWLVPLAAAAAVCAVVAGSLAISGVFHSHPARPPQLGSERVPPYYVALTLTGHGACCRPGAPSEPRTRAVVRATATGAVLATIIPPRPYGTFVGVAAAGDDRTFVLGAQRDGNIPASGLGNFPATRFFLLRIDPASASASGRATLTPLPIPAVPASSQLYNFALSPQGTSLALLVEQGIQVFNVATGAERTWEIPVPGTRLHRGLGGYFALGAGATDEMLAWGGTHTLAWIYYGGPPAGGAASGAGIRLLDTRARGSNLLTDSRLVVPQPRDIVDPGSYWRQALPTVAGRAIFAVLELTGRSGLRQELAEYSARTGRLLLVLNHVRIHGNYEQVLWASLSGHSLVVSGVGRSPGPGNLAGVGVLTGEHLKPIPWPGQNFAAAW